MFADPYFFQIDPSMVPGLIRAWRPDEGITTGANGITNVAGAWGTSVALTQTGANCPDAGTGLATDDTDLFDFASADSEYFTFTTTGSIQSFSAVFSFAPSQTGSNVAIVGSNANANTYLRMAGTMVAYQVRAGTTDTSHNLVVPTITKNLHVGAVTYNASTGIACGWLDGVKGTPSNIGTGLTFTWNRIGAHGVTPAAFWQGYLGGVALYNVALADAAVSGLTDYFAQKWKATTVYAANAGSDSSVTQWKQATPLAKVSVAMTHAKTGITVAPKGGDVFRETTRVTSGIDGSNSALRAVLDGSLWGTGKPQVRFSTTPALTNTSGTIYSLAGTFLSTQLPVGPDGVTMGGYIPYVPGGVITFGAGYETTNVVRLTYQDTDPTNPASGTWAWDSGTGIVYVNAGVALSDGDIEMPYIDRLSLAVNGIRIDDNNWIMKDIVSVFGNDEGIQFRGASNVTADNCESWFGGSDGFGGSDSGAPTYNRNILLYQTVAAYCGSGLTGLGVSRGDGYSFHDTSEVELVECKSINNDKSGYNNVHDSVTTLDRCLAIGTAPFVHTDTLHDDAGSMTLENCIGVVVSGAPYPHGAVNTGLFASPLTANNCTFVSEDGTGNGIYQGTAVARTTAQNTIIVGFDIGIAGVSGTTAITANHNLLFDNNTNYSNVSAGTGDVLADPKFTDQAGRDFTLQSDSPAIDAGIDLEIDVDYAGNVRTNPDIGAYEHA